MSCKTRVSLNGIRVAVALLTLICSAALLRAQNATVPTDPGPRPTGNEQLGSLHNPDAVCPVNGAKFPETVCLDFVQPPSASIVPADGAGQVLGAFTQNFNLGNLGGLWFEGLTVFETLASVDGTDNNHNAGQFITGLGPSFNAESCLQCHSQPAVGGSSPGCVDIQGTTNTFCSAMTADSTTGKITSIFNSGNNPQVVDAHDRGANNEIPSFVNQATGPLLEARFPKAVGDGPGTIGNPASVPKGAVAELFVIANRTDAPPGCKINQIDFQTQQTAGNVVFRIPIPTFGDGLVENVPEPTLAANLAANGKLLGVTGNFNLSGNDQTFTRFGWKAQNKSLLIFSGEASNVEMGVTNEMFQTERTYGNFPNCTNVNTLPEDLTVVLASGTAGAGFVSQTVADTENDAVFMRLNGAPSICNFNSGINSTTGFANCNAPGTGVVNGSAIFGACPVVASTTGTGVASCTTTIIGTPEAGLPNVGCGLCHSATLTTGPSATPGLNNQTFHPFSDFALHHMGGLADGVSQGSAAGDQFRTAPLWGMGQRLFFLHDGREPEFPPSSTENPLLNVILDHCLPPTGTNTTTSEACQVVANFNNLTTGQQQELINFLRSL